jgi:hypothetical protein
VPPVPLHLCQYNLPTVAAHRGDTGTHSGSDGPVLIAPAQPILSCAQAQSDSAFNLV